MFWYTFFSHNNGTCLGGISMIKCSGVPTLLNKVLLEDIVEALRVAQSIGKKYAIDLSQFLSLLLPKALQEHDQLKNIANIFTSINDLETVFTSHFSEERQKRLTVSFAY